MDAIFDGETQPLLCGMGHEIERQPSRNDSQPFVDFDIKYDADNPRDWSNGYKRGVVSLLALMAFMVTFTCIGIVPVAERVVFDLEGREDKSASILLVTVWELGEAAGPMLIAPLSELYGRYPIYNIANVLLIVGGILAALSPTANLFILSRALTGLAVASNVLNPAIIADLYPNESQGSAMSLITLAPLLGGAIGPVVCGVIAERFGWRTVLWTCVVGTIIVEIVFFMLLRETYKVPILQRRAARLRKERDDETIKCAWEPEEAGSSMWWTAFGSAIKRPLVVLYGSVVLQVLAIYGMMIFSFFYVLATTLPGILKDVYGFTESQIGYSFICFSIGSSCGVLFNNKFSDRLYIYLGKRHPNGPQPEHRLPFTIAGGIMLPAIAALYGWSAAAHFPLYITLISVAMFGCALIIGSQPVFLYATDAFGLYSASALTMVLVARCLGGTFLPLIIPPLTEALGLGYGFTVLGAILLAMLPGPLILLQYGEKWRRRSEYSRKQ